MPGNDKHDPAPDPTPSEEVAGQGGLVEDTATDRVNGDLVKVRGSSVGTVQALSVEVSQSGVNQLNSQSVTLRQAGAIIIQAEAVQVEQGGVLLARGQQVDIQDGGAAIVAAEAAHLETSQVALLVGNDVQATDLRTVILLSGRVEGKVTTYLDTPRALLAGLVSGVAMGMVVLVGRLLTRRR